MQFDNLIFGQIMALGCIKLDAPYRHVLFPPTCVTLCHLSAISLSDVKCHEKVFAPMLNFDF